VPRRLLPLPPSFPLARLVALGRLAEPLGVWLEAARPPVRLVVPGPGGRRLLLFASDLGTLLALTPRVVVWDGRSLRVIAARALARARRLALGLDRAGPAGTPDLAGLVSRLDGGRPRRGDVSVRQPIDCVAERPLA
jgi:hypothetical protein